MGKQLLDNIKALCKKNNVSVTELSVKLGFARATLSKWDTNEPTIDRLQVVADYFNVSIDYLIGRTDISAKTQDLYDDKDILTLQRLRSNLSVKNREKMMKLLQLQFDEDFPKEGNNNDDNTE